MTGHVDSDALVPATGVLDARVVQIIRDLLTSVIVCTHNPDGANTKARELNAYTHALWTVRDAVYGQETGFRNGSHVRGALNGLWDSFTDRASLAYSLTWFDGYEVQGYGEAINTVLRWLAETDTIAAPLWNGALA